MEHQNKNSHNQGGGFVFGLVLGSIATLLFTTKKGRELVKEMTDSALDKFADLQKGLDEAVEVEEIDGDDYIDHEDRSDAENEPKLLASESKKSESTAKSSIRRFFKNSKKN